MAPSAGRRATTAVGRGASSGRGTAWTSVTSSNGVRAQSQPSAAASATSSFERIAGVLDFDQSGAIWVTARPGCEFEAPGGKPHVGGASHGALHALDSLSPVLIAGGPVRPRLSRHFRCIDIAPLCMQLLNVPMRYAPGMPRGSHALQPVSPRRSLPSSRPPC